MSFDFRYPILLVGWEPDWQVLYSFGTKRIEGHDIQVEEIGPYIAAAALGSHDTKVYSTHVEEDEADEWGEYDIPHTVAELERNFPKAFARISAND